MIFGYVDEIAVEFEVDDVGTSEFLFGRCCLIVNKKKYFQTVTNISLNVVLNFLRKRVEAQPLARSSQTNAEGLFLFGCLINGYPGQHVVPISPLASDDSIDPELSAFIDDYDLFLDRIRTFFQEGNAINFGGELHAEGLRCFLFERELHELLIVSENDGRDIDLHVLPKGAYDKFVDTLPEKLR
jgi:hypothetical protein